MKAILSTTYDDRYFFFLPIVAWSWNKIGVDVINFLPAAASDTDYNKYLEWLPRTNLIHNTIHDMGIKCEFQYFNCPDHKAATYAQCSRLYGACLDLPEDEILVTADVDMAIFGKYLFTKHATLDIYGADLVPEGQVPMCYVSAPVSYWRGIMDINGRNLQECLNELVGSIECEHFRGNQWSLDQGTLYKQLFGLNKPLLHAYQHWRGRPGTQFAGNRVDRDDNNWREYVNPSLIDAHLWRPGFSEENFEKILNLFEAMYPEEDFMWMIDYRNQYLKLI